MPIEDTTCWSPQLHNCRNSTSLTYSTRTLPVTSPKMSNQSPEKKQKPHLRLPHSLLHCTLNKWPRNHSVENWTQTQYCTTTVNWRLRKHLKTTRETQHTIRSYHLHKARGAHEFRSVRKIYFSTTENYVGNYIYGLTREPRIVCCLPCRVFVCLLLGAGCAMRACGAQFFV